MQASGCAPIVDAFDKNLDAAPLWENAHTQAFGLRVPKAIGDFLMLKILRETAGAAIAVDDETLLKDMLHLGATEGINACPEGGACVSAVRVLRREGLITEDDEVVVFNTGAGTKYLESLPEVS